MPTQSEVGTTAAGKGAGPLPGLLVRRLTPQECKPMLALVWETYLQFEAPDYAPQGVEIFRREIVEGARFRQDCITGKNRMWGAFYGDLLVGTMVMRGEGHICLAFTHRDYHRRGVATAIFRRLEQEVRQENPALRQITLNAAPYGLPFYRHLGFAATAQEQCRDGVRFTPMAYPLQ